VFKDKLTLEGTQQCQIQSNGLQFETLGLDRTCELTCFDNVNS